ncbi:hypothetical protein FZI85_29840 [Mycobacterium sp. CBMA293]|nr:hypothetical protein [Mycolicibacterium sp. CBMA 360]MUL62715.1 hypothetical protein [Mycolicibacterium sp. CBMA 335]MUL70737.1 hypothetical protein [Mycolicibacterium sp. CBMA 311]MUL97239.1 hypothetical protein [Mycolicibacterium sp. CBMA 230]MUM07987.1 hypothetical protein [Mycolicibacterium sp. CBMA 213]MUM15196.1 hypothetical protein [Mycolicibacterium sp. CBMA 293]
MARQWSSTAPCPRRRGDPCARIADQPADLPSEPTAAPASRKLTYLENVERDAIAALLAAHRGNKRRVADVLGISRSTLYRKMATLDLD